MEESMAKKQSVTPKPYLTADLHEAAAISIFQKPISIENSGPRFLFSFPQDPGERLAREYRTGALKGGLQDYANSIRSLKDWLFSEKRKLAPGYTPL